jgi:hypothetical protein
MITRTDTCTVSRTPLDEGFARRRNFHLTTHYVNERQTSIPAAGFESKITGTERSQTFVLGRAQTGIGDTNY